MKTQRIFSIPGAPVAKGRPRFRVFKGHVMTYTPAKTRLAEKAILDAYNAEFADEKPLEGPIMIAMEFYMPIPSSLPEKKRAELKGSVHVKLPDIDNLIKSVQDALNGVAWIDDKQIVSCSAKKRYTYTSEGPFTRVFIQEL